jgi:hypothetical protein
VDNLGFPTWANLLIMGSPVMLVSAYVFGLKQGKPKSYDIELAEWLLIKILGINYFSPKQVEQLKLPWTEPVKKPNPSQKPPSDGQNR